MNTSPTPREEIRAPMRRAAELRACGRSWESIGTELGCDERTCGRWRARYPALWQRLFRTEEEDLHEHLGIEAAIVLKKALRSKDERLKQDAAQFVYGQRRATCRHNPLP